MNIKSNLEEIVIGLKGKLFDRLFMDRLGLMITDMIYKRVKTGYGVNGTKKEKLKSLSDSYIQYRKGKMYFFKKNGITIAVKGRSNRLKKTGEFFSPARSNLTMTGQMLKAIEFKVKDTSVTVYINNNVRDDGKTNEQVAQLVSKDRPFLGITESESRILKNFIKNHIIEQMKSMIKK